MNNKGAISFSTVIILLLIAAILAGIAVFHFEFRLENLDVRTGSFYTQEELEKKLFTRKTDQYTYLFALRLNKLERVKLPFVEKIDVEVTDRNSAVVYVYDKPIIGCIKLMDMFICFDREGIVIDSAKEKPQGVPLIEGLDFSEFTLGKQLDGADGRDFATILDILMLLEKNGLDPENVVFGLRSEVTLYLGGNEILLGKDTNYALKINNIRAIIEAATIDSQYVYRFDMRNYNENNMEVYVTQKTVNNDFETD